MKATPTAAAFLGLLSVVHGFSPSSALLLRRGRACGVANFDQPTTPPAFERLGAITREYKQREREKLEVRAASGEKEPFVIFTEDVELLNGRVAMLAGAVLMTRDLIWGESVVHQCASLVHGMTGLL
jgi:hypothetical protein